MIIYFHYYKQDYIFKIGKKYFCFYDQFDRWFELKFSHKENLKYICKI